VSARSCAEIPVDVPAASIHSSCTARGGEQGEKAEEKRRVRTVFVVDCNGVCSSVALLILWDHHRDGERLEPVTW